MTSLWIRFSLLLCAAGALLLPRDGQGQDGRGQDEPGAIRVTEEALIPEGIAWDPEDGVFFLSSIHRRSVFRVDRDGRTSALGPVDDPDAFAMLGLKVDAEGRRLWACSSGVYPGPNAGRTALYQFDLSTGRVLQRFAPPGDARGTMLNDLVVTREGRVYATDMARGSLQTISGPMLVPTYPESTFVGPNGIALSPDERVLFVADDRGIHRLEMVSGRPTGAPRLLPLPPGVRTLGGIDGLYAIPGSLIGIQNGSPGKERILRARLNAAADSVIAVETLAEAHPRWDIPTTGTFVGGEFWYIARSGLDRIDAEGRPTPFDRLLYTEILRLSPSLGLPGAPPSAAPLHVFLIGDGGKPRAGGEPVLEALRTEIARDPERSLVVLLGDNIYPAGLPDSSDGRRGEMERRLTDQLAALRGAGLGAYVIPGNHDWVKGGKDGWEAVRRQDRLVQRVAAAGGPLLRLIPTDGCPGPAVVDVAPTLRLVALDTQWWLHAGPKPLDPNSACACDAPDEITSALSAALRDTGGRSVLVVGHHPLASHGPHGGHFPLIDHLFPLRVFNDALWLPLPLVGSLYPVARRNGISEQDLSAGAYERMRVEIEGVLAENPPLLYASGHDHNLQVLSGHGARNNVVSGCGIFGHGERVAWKEDTRFATRDAGFMRVDLEADGSGRLVVFAVAKDGTARTVWSGPLR